MLLILSALSVGIKHVVKTNLLQVSLWSTAAQLFKTSLPQSLSLIMAADRRFSTNGLKSFNGYIKTPFLIGVAGGTASGKSTVCSRIMEKLGQDEMDHRQRQVVCISQDSFYRELNAAESLKASKGLFNFDHPDAFDNQLIIQTLQDIIEGRVVRVPVYDFKTNSRKLDEFITIYPADVLLFEGILVFYFPEIRNFFHMKLFVDTDADTRLSRRVLRDIRERGRDLEQVLSQYTTLVKPAFEEFCLPTKKFADVIIPRGADNVVAIDLICQNIFTHISNASLNGGRRGTYIPQTAAILSS